MCLDLRIPFEFARRFPESRAAVAADAVRTFSLPNGFPSIFVDRQDIGIAIISPLTITKGRAAAVAGTNEFSRLNNPLLISFNTQRPPFSRENLRSEPHWEQ